MGIRVRNENATRKRIKILTTFFAFLFPVLPVIESSSCSNSNPFTAINLIRRICDTEHSDKKAKQIRFEMAQHTVTTLAGIRMPKLIYGTAWKKERTEELVTLAIKKGFRGIDTACQPKHYHEPGVGAALEKLIKSQEMQIQRSDIFLQTKFTPLNGQDVNRLPYDPKASLSDQVKQSLQTSLLNLRTSYIDSLVLHSPLSTFKETLEVWRVFESFVSSGQVRQLGMSNCYDLSVLKRLWEAAEVKPSVIQNRLYEDTDFDVDIREFAKDHGIFYQSFWTLTANPGLLRDSRVKDIAKKHGKTVEQVFFGYLMNSAGIVPLTGTTKERHMEEDLQALDLNLSKEQANVFHSFINSKSASFNKLDN